MELGLRDRTVLVAGGSRGMGRATAELLAREGCRVAVLGRTRADLETTAAALWEQGAADVLTLEADLRAPAAVATAFQALAARFGLLHALVCATGPERAGMFHELSDADWMDAFDAGVLSAVRCVRAALPLLRRASDARIVTLGATSTRHQNPRLIAYTAAKAALVSMTKNLARGLAPEGIAVNCICPGWVLTPSIAGALRELSARAGRPPDDLAAAYELGAQTFGAANDVGRIGRAEEVAVLATLLCSPVSGFTVGAIIPVDGGTDFF